MRFINQILIWILTWVPLISIIGGNPLSSRVASYQVRRFASYIESNRQKLTRWVRFFYQFLSGNCSRFHAYLLYHILLLIPESLLSNRNLGYETVYKRLINMVYAEQKRVKQSQRVDLNGAAGKNPKNLEKQLKYSIQKQYIGNQSRSNVSASLQVSVKELKFLCQ